ncbi:MAG TPA: oligoribonuclease [Candidatus Saccharimonadales bacterium]|nr:oligoribonuclease [Candidatus Saccharimonadales bacterium]
MADQKRITPDKILWVDLEMTGLNPTKDRILEVAAIVTDWDFNELGKFESGVGHDQAALKILMDANPWAVDHPELTESLLKLSNDSEPEEFVQAKFEEFINEHFEKGQPVLLAGNSIHMDRQFIRHWWPEVEKRLHYRMLDVSAWKVVMIGKYGTEYEKLEKHRALDDIRESIEELEFYLSKVTD